MLQFKNILKHIALIRIPSMQNVPSPSFFPTWVGFQNFSWQRKRRFCITSFKSIFNYLFQHPCPRKTGCLICALQLVHEVKWFVYSLNTDWASNLLPDFLKEVLQQETILSYTPTMVLLNPANPRMKNWSLQEIEGTGWAHKSVKPLFIVSNSSSLVQWLSESFFFSLSAFFSVTF